MASKAYMVWAFTDREANVRFLAFGKPARGSTPWELVWASRYRDDTALAHWLRDWSEIPPHRILQSGLSHIAAEELFTAERRRLLETNAELLSTRDRSTYVTGGGERKPVIVDDVQFKSIRHAARVLDLNPSTVQRRVRDGKDARYV